MMDDLSGEFPFRLFTPKLRYRLYQPDDTAARCGGFIPSGEVIRWRAWCEAPYLRHYNGVFSTSAVAADTNHADLQTSLVRLGRIELPRASCSSLPFTKCRVLPHLRSGLGGFIILVESATKPTRGRFGGCGGDLNPAWCRQYATSFVPVRGSYFNPNRFECVALSCTAYPCCLFHSATHPFWPSSTLRLSHHGLLPSAPLHCASAFPKKAYSTYRAVFSGHFRSLCGSTVAHTSSGSDPATGGTDQTRTGGLLIPNQARYQLRYGSILAADGGVDPHGFRRALFSRQAQRPLEFICRMYLILSCCVPVLARFPRLDARFKYANST